MSLAARTCGPCDVCAVAYERGIWWLWYIWWSVERSCVRGRFKLHSLPQLCFCSSQTHTPPAHQPFLACTSTGELWMWPFCIAQRKRWHLCAAEDAACARICVWESTTHIFICLQVCKRLWMDEFVIVTYENVCWTSGWNTAPECLLKWTQTSISGPVPPRPSYFPALEGDTV